MRVAAAASPFRGRGTGTLLALGQRGRRVDTSQLKDATLSEQQRQFDAPAVAAALINHQWEIPRPLRRGQGTVGEDRSGAPPIPAADPDQLVLVAVPAFRILRWWQTWVTRVALILRDLGVEGEGNRCCRR